MQSFDNLESSIKNCFPEGSAGFQHCSNQCSYGTKARAEWKIRWKTACGALTNLRRRVGDAPPDVTARQTTVAFSRLPGRARIRLDR